MAKGSVNKVFLLGRLGADPQLKYTPAGKACATLSIATTETWKDANGEKKDRTDWHRVVAWGKLAEVMGEWLKKGGLVFIEGRLQTRSWDDNGTKKYITEVVANQLEMLGGGKDRAETAGDTPEGSAGPQDAGEPSDLPF